VEVMRCKIYIRIDEANFNKLNINTGKMRHYKNDKGSYWESEEKYAESASKEFNIELLNLINQIIYLRLTKGTKVSLVVVAEFYNYDDVSGFYFSKESIKLLASLDSDIDIDVYSRMETL
jgi:hypothetical protein